jgi:integrase
MTRARGSGRIYRPRYRDKAGAWQTSPRWAIRFYNRRKGKKEDLYGFATKAQAERQLRKVLTDQDAGRLVGPAVENTRFDELAKMIEADYKANRKRLPRLRQSIAHLKVAFGNWRAFDITEDRIAAYVAERLDAGAAIATVNRELAALRRMFNLAVSARRIGWAPRIHSYRETNTREGFFEEPQFRSLLRHLPLELRPPIEVAYLTGWRIASEVLTREWRHVDFVGGWLRLEPGEGKTREGRMFPLTQPLRALLERLREATDALERKGQIIPWVFHRKGRRIKSLRRPWVAACVKAGVPGRIPHDLRRTAIRNLERAGVPRSAAMRMVGHKTESVYRRYAIVDEAMLREAGERLEKLGR